MARSNATSVKRSKRVRSLYDRAHLGWRAGALSDFYYGKRDKDDDTIVWRINGIEVDGKAYKDVDALLDRAYDRAGIVSTSVWGSWVGYDSLAVEYADGRIVVERFDTDTNRVVREESAVAVAA